MKIAQSDGAEKRINKNMLDIHVTTENILSVTVNDGGYDGRKRHDEQ